MRVAFVYPPAWAPWAPSYAMGLLKAATQASGHEFFGFDLNIDLHNSVRAEQQRLWNDDEAGFWRNKDNLSALHHEYETFFDSYIDQILKADAPLVAFSVTSASTEFALTIAERLKRRNPDLYILFGGPDCFRAERGLAVLDDPSVDAVCTGEGDLVWPMFLDSFEKTGGRPEPTMGFTFKGADGELVDCGDPGPVMDLDAVPFADYSETDFAKYTLNNRVCMMMSRGCILRCAYCSEGENFIRYRYRTAEHLAGEVQLQTELLRRQSGAVPHINFSDSLINGQPQILDEFCDLVLARGIEFTWGGMALLRKEMTRDLLAKMKAAGCVEVMWGLESGNHETLMLMRKKLFDPILAEKIIKITNELGIDQYGNIIVGFPGETDEMFAETVAFVRKVKRYFTSLGLPMMEIRRNTHVYDQPDKFNIEDRTKQVDWRTRDGSNTLDIRLRRRAVLKKVLDDQLFEQGRYKEAEAALDDAVA